MIAGSQLTKLVEAILAGVKASGSRQLASWRNPERDIHNLARRDYAPSLRKHLDRADLNEVIRRARRIFAKFNRDHDPGRIERWLTGAPSHGLEALFSPVRDRLDVHFQGNPLRGPEGLALRGFFVNRDHQSLKRPLICVNTAHHPVAVAATLFHEFGHLVASDVFEQDRKPVHLFFDADYISHLDDVEELTAHIVLTLVAYPAPVAKKRLAIPRGTGGGSPKLPRCPTKCFPKSANIFRATFGVSLAAANLPRAPQAQLSRGDDPFR